MEQTREHTTREAASMLGVNERTIIRWIIAGRLPGALLRNGSRKLGWRIPSEAIEYVERGERPALQEQVSA